MTGALQRAIGRYELKLAAGIPEAATLIEEATRTEVVQREKTRVRTFPAERLGL